jgi:hypothetical protein
MIKENREEVEVDAPDLGRLSRPHNHEDKHWWGKFLYRGGMLTKSIGGCGPA